MTPPIDLAELQRIYASYVEHASVSFFETTGAADREIRHERTALLDAVPVLLSELTALREQSAAAQRLIRTVYDRMVDEWGNDGSGLKDDFDYVPELNLIRDMHRWLAVAALASAAAEAKP